MSKQLNKLGVPKARKVSERIEVTPETGNQRYFLGLRVNALIETALFFGILLVLDSTLGSGVRFWGVNPHPFWIPVLLITTQYGGSEAIFAALCASLCLLVGNLPPGHFGQDSYEYWSWAVAEPMLWFVSSVILGEIVVRHRRARDEAEKARIFAEKQADFLAQTYEQQRVVLEQSQRRLVGLQSTPAALMEALSEIDILEPEQIIVKVNELVQILVGATKHSLYLLGDSDGLVVASKQGWQKQDPFALEIGTKSALFQEIVKHGRTLSVLNSKEAEILGDQGLIAVPIIDDLHHDAVIGMIKIESMEFRELTRATVATVAMLADWVGHLYGGAWELRAVSEAESAQDGGGEVAGE